MKIRTMRVDAVTGKVNIDFVSAHTALRTAAEVFVEDQHRRNYLYSTTRAMGTGTGRRAATRAERCTLTRARPAGDERVTRATRAGVAAAARAGWAT